MTHSVAGRTAHRWYRRVRLIGWSEDRGEVTSTVLVMPVLLVMIMTVIQTGLVWHAQNITEAAANDALRAAQVESGTVSDGKAAAHQLIAQTGSDLLTDVQVQVTRGPDTVTTEVTAEVVRAIPVPGRSFTVSARAAGPVERFRSSTGGSS